jgi:hypothetical protein
MMVFDNFDGRNNAGPPSRGYWMDNVLPNGGGSPSHHQSGYYPRGGVKGRFHEEDFSSINISLFGSQFNKISISLFIFLYV